MRPASRVLRCAIYTRKSTEHGLEQEFNSLDNQREAAEAYIKSQAHEGWRPLPEAYDDGGFSGGSIERPALQRLLDEVRAGRVDVIVVYKVDRLTRSLSDFAKLVELFDANGVSFVSVTQAFNTTTSMGRLTLNVLLSFAQFEREVTGERIRDKIAASKKKGIRVGGPVPLGYVSKDKKLVPCPDAAPQVELIFRRYVELGCLTALAQDLREGGITTKINPRRDGSTRGGVAFAKGSLAYLLRNRAYVGEVVHKGLYYPGEHQPIIAPDLFGAVQDALSANANGAGTTVNTGSLLKGLLYDDCGNRMSPSSAKKGGARYRYYVSACLAQGLKENAGTVTRVSAPEIEDLVLKALPAGLGSDTPPSTAHVLANVERIVLRKDTVDIVRRGSEDAPAIPILVPWSRTTTRRRRQIIGAEDPALARPIRAETRARLVQGIAHARAWLDELASGRVKDTAEISQRHGCSERSVRMTLNLAFLSPDIMKAAVDGTLSDDFGVTRLANAPQAWSSMSTRNGPGDHGGELVTLREVER